MTNIKKKLVSIMVRRRRFVSEGNLLSNDLADESLNTLLDESGNTLASSGA